MSSTIKKIFRIASWLPILWEDEDWDQGYLLKIWAFKLKRMRLCILGNGIIVDALKVHNEIRTCEQALNRLAKEDYARIAWEKHYEKYPRMSNFIEGGLSGILPSMSEEESIDFKSVVQLEEDERKADEDLFLETFRKHYRGWWD